MVHIAVAAVAGLEMVANLVNKMVGLGRVMVVFTEATFVVP